MATDNTNSIEQITALSSSNIKNINSAVTTYLTAINGGEGKEGISKRMNDEVTALLQNDFIGKAADGFSEFYNTNVYQYISTEIAELMKGLTDKMAEIENAMITQADTQLAESNKQGRY